MYNVEISLPGEDHVRGSSTGLPRFRRGGISAVQMVRILDWERLEHEQLQEDVARRVLHSERLTIARIYLKKGAMIPRHSHENEQVSQVLEGRLRFDFDGRSAEIAAGGIVQIAPHEPHRVEALEDSLALDIFHPVREDWLRGDDSYLRKPSR